MQYSKYYGLWLPEGAEFFSKDHANHNMEAVDTLLKDFDDAKIGMDKVSKNFTTEDWGQIAAAPLVKQLYEENQSLKEQVSALNKKFSQDHEDIVTINTVESNSITNVAGGYYYFGRIVIVDLTFKTTGIAHNGEYYIPNLKRPRGGSIQLPVTIDGENSFSLINSYGSLFITNEVDKNYRINTVYFTD